MCRMNRKSTMSNRQHRQSVSFSVCLLYVCAVLVGSASIQRRDDECVLELCWSTTVYSDRCAAECERLLATPAVGDDRLDEASMLPPLVNRRSPSSFVRIGRPGVADKRYSSFVRIGRPSAAAAPGYKRYSSFVRIGRAAGTLARHVAGRSDEQVPAVNKRRYSSFVRIGRNAEPSTRR